MEKKKPSPRVMTLAEFDERFSDEDSCWQYLYFKRWPDKIRCPRCGFEPVYALTKEWHWQCRNCGTDGYRFSLLVGTIFENTNLPLLTWFKVIHAMLLSKKGVSAMQVSRTFGMSYPTAWKMCHKIRDAMGTDQFKKLTGFVEIDETYVGGKEKNKHWNKRNFPGGGTGGKMPVVGAVSRGGKIVAKAVDKPSAQMMGQFVLDHISQGVKLIATDESRLYWGLGLDKWPHKWVNHGRKEYVRREVHTGSIDSFWALIKRGVMGTYHSVSRKHLQKYVNEFVFRHNHRDSEDMFGVAIAAC